VGLSAIRAAAAGHALVLDDLAIKVVLGLDNAAKEHPAVHAGTRAQALKAAELRLYSVVVILGWVRIVRYSHGVNLLCRLAGLRGVPSTCGAASLGVALYSADYTIYNTQCAGLISK
jgi:hypothetical protein